MLHSAVRLRGWPVPYVGHPDTLLRGDDWIGQDIDAATVDQYEAWRFFASGQFSHLRVVSADWRAGSDATPIPPGAASVIEVWEILFYLTEVFELATRLALGPAGDEQMIVHVALHGLKGRALVVGQRNRAPFMSPQKATVEWLARSETVGRDELVAENRQLAVKLAREFFLRFGWEPSLDQLAAHQQELAT